MKNEPSSALAIDRILFGLHSVCTDCDRAYLPSKAIGQAACPYDDNPLYVATQPNAPAEPLVHIGTHYRPEASGSSLCHRLTARNVVIPWPLSVNTPDRCIIVAALPPGQLCPKCVLRTELVLRNANREP